jgi:hypothetical protein
MNLRFTETKIFGNFRELLINSEKTNILPNLRNFNVESSTQLFLKIYDFTEKLAR